MKCTLKTICQRSKMRLDCLSQRLNTLFAISLLTRTGSTRIRNFPYRAELMFPQKVMMISKANPLDCSKAHSCQIFTENQSRRGRLNSAAYFLVRSGLVTSGFRDSSRPISIRLCDSRHTELCRLVHKPASNVVTVVAFRATGR
jgi:hypothetical protein